MTTWQGWAHTVVGLMYFIVTCVLPLIAWRVFHGKVEWRSLGPVSLAAGLLLVALFLVGPFLFGADRVGIWQRTTTVLAGAWTAMVALRLLRLHRENVPTVLPA